MINKLFVVAISSMLILGTSAFAQEERKKETVRRQRMENQQKRINRGVKDGSLTKKEAVKLEMKEGALVKEAREQRKDGNGLSVKEKAQINRRQNKLSEDIHKERHDAQTRKP